LHSDSDSGTSVTIGGYDVIDHVQREIEIGKLMAEFPDVLTDKLGHADLIEHEIELFEGTKPIAQKTYRLSPAKEHIDCLLLRRKLLVNRFL
jgi:hypothetical protein